MSTMIVSFGMHQKAYLNQQEAVEYMLSLNNNMLQIVRGKGVFCMVRAFDRQPSRKLVRIAAMNR